MREGSIEVYSPIKPLVSPEKAAEEWALFEALKARILKPWGDPNTDFQRIRVRERQLDGGYRLVAKDFIKRSGFRKLAVYFGLSDRIVEQERTYRDDDSIVWRIVVEVSYPNGRICTGVGVCDSRERGFAHLEHDVYATAHTRAKNRAISDMIAGGIVSAEEMSNDERTPRRRMPSQQRSNSTKLRSGRLSLEVVRYNIKAVGVDVQNLHIEEHEDCFHIGSKDIEDEDWYKVNGVVENLGGVWEDRPPWRWRIPKEAP